MPRQKLDAGHLQSLLQGCARGNEADLKLLYEATSSHLFAVCMRMLRRADLAEEVLQDSFVSIWNGASGYDSKQSQPMTWMNRIVRNRCIDLLRRPSIEVPDVDEFLVDAWADEAPGPMGRLEATEEGRRLASCLKGLESKQRMAIALSYFEDSSHSEIASQMRAPLGTVKSWVRRGMELLKRCLA